MNKHFPPEAQKIMAERFGHDALIALATLDNGLPAVRTVDSLYEDGAFYVVTHAQSGKMQQIAAQPAVAISGDWFTARGVGENLGHILAPQNAGIADKLRAAFSAWYGNGHVNEQDPGTCILCIRLTEGVLFADGVRYDIRF